MDRKYWEKIAPDYNNEIFDVLHNDKKAIIRKAINRLGSRHRDVLDAGCAVGKWLPVLSPAFKKVIAADISAKNLDIAKANYQDFSNIEYLRVDMSAPGLRLPKVDVVVCINAILTSSMKKRDAFFSIFPAAQKSMALLSWLYHRWNLTCLRVSYRINGKSTRT